jgi:hypothetical protein
MFSSLLNNVWKCMDWDVRVWWRIIWIYWIWWWLVWVVYSYWWIVQVVLWVLFLLLGCWDCLDCSLIGKVMKIVFLYLWLVSFRVLAYLLPFCSFLYWICMSLVFLEWFCSNINLNLKMINLILLMGFLLEITLMTLETQLKLFLLLCWDNNGIKFGINVIWQ